MTIGYRFMQWRYVTVSVKTVNNDTLGISRNTIKATAVLLCCILIMLDLQYN